MLRIAILFLLVLNGTLDAQPPIPPLVEQVRASIDRGIRFLRRKEAGRGNWEIDGVAAQYPGGPTALATLALLNSGVPPQDPLVQRALNYLRTVEPKYVYVVGLQTMVYAEVNDVRDRERIQSNVDWLIKARAMRDGQLMGWGYDLNGGPRLDNSNSQYALLGLHAGRQAGAKIDIEVWKSIRDFYRETQVKNIIHQVGGWGYNLESSRRAAAQSPILTMTIAGICGLQIVAMELNENRQGLQIDGTATACGRYVEDENLAKALRWLDGRFRFDEQYTYYNCYGIERAGRLTGLRFLAGRDWYREGCEYLVALQKEDDSWTSKDGTGGFPPSVSTSLALLFLSKGRTPVLISKWAHGAENGWNNKHNDVKNLVEFASREMFKNQPLAWQNYDARRIDFKNVQQRLREIGTLLQSPIVYMNGHEAPRMTATQKQILKQYIDEGGFVFAEACCGREAFAFGFRSLMTELFPEHQLRPLPPEHPIYRSWKPVSPESVPLEGIDMGCKTVVVFSPKPLAGFWEENLFRDGGDELQQRGSVAFRAAGNVIAYATGLEAPKPRLNITDIVDAKPERDTPRGFLQVAQLRHEGDWQPAPKAMRNLMLHLREREKLDVALRTEEMTFANPELFKYKFLYLHGRGAFSIGNDGLENLRSNLKSGAVLLADACCGSPTFDASFREIANQLFPGAKLEPIPPGDPLYSAELNGDAIDKIKLRVGGPGSGYDEQAPALEGLKIDGRWVVIYSRYDIGCALEKHQSGDCKGHDHDSAMRLASAAVLYLLKQ